MHRAELLRRFLTRFAVCLAFLVLGTASCKSGTSAPETLKPVTDEEATTFAKTLEETLDTCNGAKLKALVDVEAAMRRAIRKSTIPKGQQEVVLKGMLRGAQNGNVLSQLCGTGEENAIARFVRLRERDQRKSALFRLSSSEGINYVEFYLGKSKDDRVIADNFYAYLSGTDLVETFRAPLDALIETPSAAQSFGEVLTTLDSDPKRGLARMASLPPSLRNVKMLQVAAVVAAIQVDEATYANAISTYEKLFPNDPSLDLITIDGLVMAKKFTEALASIDRFEAALGGDPYLNQLRAGILIEQGKDFGKAAKHAAQAIESEPTDTDSYYLLLAAELANKNAVGAVAAIDALAKTFDLSFGPADAVGYAETFPEFPESREWQAYLEAHPPANDEQHSDE